MGQLVCLKCGPRILHRDPREQQEPDIKSENGGVPATYELGDLGQVISLLRASVSSYDLHELVLTWAHALAFPRSERV